MDIWHLLFVFSLFRNEKAAQRVSFGAGYPADVHADIPADVRGQKLRSGPRNAGKTSISVRTSMTRRRGRPPPERGEKKNFDQKNFGLNFRSLSILLPKKKPDHITAKQGPIHMSPANRFINSPPFTVNSALFLWE